MGTHLVQIRRLAIFALMVTAAGLAAYFSADPVTAGPHVQEMRGVYNGFIQEGDNPVELIRTEITEQNNRRFSGIVDAGGPHVIDGTVSASGNVNYIGRSDDGGRINGTFRFKEFDGGAGLLEGTHKARTPTGATIIPCVLQLRSFAGDGSVVPNPAGSYPGTISDAGGPIGEVNMFLGAPPDPVQPSFDGSLNVRLGDNFYEFQLIGTIRASDGFVVIIGHQAAAGHAVIEGFVDPSNSSFAGTIEVELPDGSELNFEVRPRNLGTPTPTPTATATPTATTTPSPTPSPTATATPAASPTPPATPTPTATTTPSPTPTPTPTATPTATATPATPTPTPTPPGPLPVVTISVSPNSVGENGTTNLVYTISRSNTNGPLTVPFSISGTATQGSDFTVIQAGNSSFPAGVATRQVTIDPTPDSVPESPESVTLTLTPGNGYTVGSPGSATGTIIDIDTVFLAPGSTNEAVPENGLNMSILVRRTGTVGALTVNFTTSGTATLGTDYLLNGSTTSTGTIVIPDGANSASLLIDPTNDPLVEPDETVIITLQPSTTYLLGSPTSLTRTILNDDLPACGPEILYYKFDGSGTSVPNLASSPPAGTATATINGAQTQGGTGQFGGALNGSGGGSGTDFVNTNWRTALTNTNWTISFFIKNTGTPTGARYIFGDASASSFRAFYGGAAGTNGIMLRGGFNDVLAPGAVGPSTSSVVHFVYSTTTDDIRAYVNGVLVNTVPQTTVNITATGFLKVGGYSTLSGLSLGAAMDEFRVYNRALTATEIAASYNQPLQPCANVSVSVSPSSAVEDGPATLNYTFTRSGSTSQPLTVNFSVGGTAVFSGGIDYTVSGAASFTNTAGSVTFPAGAATAVVTVNPLSDSVAESPETVVFTVVAGVQYRPSPPASATGTIYNGNAPT